MENKYDTKIDDYNQVYYQNITWPVNLYVLCTEEGMFLSIIDEELIGVHYNIERAIQDCQDWFEEN